MHAVPIPDGVAEAMGGVRQVLGEPGDPTDPALPFPAEYVVTPSTLYPGRPCFHALVALSDDDREHLTQPGSHLLLTLDGGEVPWSITPVVPS